MWECLPAELAGREYQFAAPANEFALDHLDSLGGSAALQQRVRAEPVHVGKQQGHRAVEEGRRLGHGKPLNCAAAPARFLGKRAASGQGRDQQHAQCRHSDPGAPHFRPMPQSAVHDPHIAAEYTSVAGERHVRKSPGAGRKPMRGWESSWHSYGPLPEALLPLRGSWSRGGGLPGDQVLLSKSSMPGLEKRIRRAL